MQLCGLLEHRIAAPSFAEELEAQRKQQLQPPQQGALPLSPSTEVLQRDWWELQVRRALVFPPMRLLRFLYWHWQVTLQLGGECIQLWESASTSPPSPVQLVGGICSSGG